MINPSSLWASSYESKWKEVFDKAKEEGANLNQLTADAWGEWCNENANKIQCVSPTSAPITLTGNTNAKAFAPVIFSAAKTPPQSAKVVADAWMSWAMAITWTAIPPSPPFSAIISVFTDPASVSGAHAVLLTGLTSEFAIVPAGEAGLPAKYASIGSLFSTAAMALKVTFSGLTIPPPTPIPLIIPVPVF